MLSRNLDGATILLISLFPLFVSRKEEARRRANNRDDSISH